MSTKDPIQLWNRFKKYFLTDTKLGVSIDISRMNFTDSFFGEMNSKIDQAFQAMESLEKGSIANPDEKRMVGHYWLRNSALAPNEELKSQINQTLSRIKAFTSKVHKGEISPQKGGRFESILVVGIGGSALGPQFVTQALGTSSDKMEAFFFDNTDPDGMVKVLKSIPDLAKNLTIVISKSGGTKETRNGQLIAKQAYTRAGLAFAQHFVAVTGEGSELDKTAVSEKWLERFPMWDWVGGRTSEFSAVGLVPAALQGFDIDGMLLGASDMDALTRTKDAMKNPAMMMALMWYHAGKGKGAKDMVILPYKDRIELLSRYLQQLVMESVGKEKDLNGATVNQGIAVYGNKGSTDQHAYVQQLRDGVNNFFAVFIEVLRDNSGLESDETTVNFEVEPGVTCGDYLSGFYQGTRQALFEKDRESVTITVEKCDAHTVGMLIALFERAVGLYATLINVNAYHQPGVEAGKKAAAAVLDIQARVVSALKGSAPMTVDEVVSKIDASNSVETVFMILRHLSSNGKVKSVKGTTVFENRYTL